MGEPAHDNTPAGKRRYRDVRLWSHGRSAKMRGLRGEYIAEKWRWRRFYRRFYEIQFLTFIRKKYGNGGTYIDVGANIGNHTAFFAAICRADRVVAIEPDALNFELLSYNIAANNFTGVEAHRCGLSDSPARARVDQVDESNRGMGVVIIDEDGDVDLVRMDDLVTGDVKLIKIDVEGHGLAVLNGGLETLRREKPIIAVEIAPEPLESFEALLEPMGYRNVGRFNFTPTYVFEPNDRS